ncbi:hypothetical protein [Spirosoma flavum]|uniref:Helix-turn-helix transcriptional regulator n=1 Tax=Spirosoma flavum TaxID=2048557 RepID=A0ABW6ARG0_9BACT
MNLQISINTIQSRGYALVYKGSTCYIYSFADQHLVLPLKSMGQVPSGTLDTIFRSGYTPKATSYDTACQKSREVSPLTVVLEKQGGQLWGRIEQKGLLAVVSGSTREAIAKKLSLQLKEFTTYLHTQDRTQKVIPDDFVFDYRYDLTLLRELFQQFRITYLAEQTNISQELLSQFMTNKQYPSTQQAQQIEALIQQFGRDMLNFSLL